jgi:hypothetical protein
MSGVLVAVASVIRFRERLHCLAGASVDIIRSTPIKH